MRHRGTIGGSIAHGDPASDLPAVLVARCDFVVQGSGERTLPAGEFFTGFFETTLGPHDVLTEIRVPKLDASGWSYLKFPRRPGLGHGRCRGCPGSNGTGPAWRLRTWARRRFARTAEEALRTADDIAAAAEAVAADSDPPNDTDGSAEYRLHLAAVLTRRALEEARSR